MYMYIDKLTLHICNTQYTYLYIQCTSYIYSIHYTMYMYSERRVACTLVTCRAAVGTVSM